MVVGQGEWAVTFTLRSYGRYGALYLGLVRPGLNEGDGSDRKAYRGRGESRAWWLSAGYGWLYGSGKEGDDGAGDLSEGDRLTVVVTADGGVGFGRNGKQHGPGWPAGSIERGTVVVPAVQMGINGDSVKLEAATGAEETAWAR